MALWYLEYFAVGFSHNRPAAFDGEVPVFGVDERVVSAAEESAVVEFCFAAVVPFVAVMNVAPGWWPAQPGNAQPPSLRVIARRIGTGHNLVSLPMSSGWESLSSTAR